MPKLVLSFLFILLFVQIPAWAYDKQNYFIKSPEKHKIIIVNNAILALEYRLKLIESAKKSIDFETYLFLPGYGTDLLLESLGRKAKQGVKVRLLIDYSRIYSKAELLQNIADNLNIEIQYFNTFPSRFNYRNHRKTLCIDGGAQGCLIGGRNITDSYWAMDSIFNHLDRDVLIQGPINKAIHETFLDYWNSPFARRVPYNKNIKLAERDYLDKAYCEKKKQFDDLKIAELRNDLQAATYKILTEPKKFFDGENSLIEGVCESVVFISDLPDKKLTINNTKPNLTAKALANYLSGAKKELLFENSAFLISYSRLGGVINDLLKEKVQIEALFLGEDADFWLLGLANSKDAKIYNRRGLKAYVKNLTQIPDYSFIRERFNDTNFLIHSKTFLLDPDNLNSSFWIGSYNLDPRSENLNNELGFICYGAIRANKALKESMYKWQSTSTSLIEQEKSKGKVKLKKVLAKPLLKLLRKNF